MWTQIRDIGQRMQLKEWTPEFRDGVGRMLHLNLGIPVAQTPPAAAEPRSRPLLASPRSRQVQAAVADRTAAVRPMSFKKCWMPGTGKGP
jgi:hypothetical protein